MTRRGFLAGVGAVAVAGMAAGCGGVVRADLEDGPEGTGSAALDAAERSILAYAALAPSSHNTQPWRVRRLPTGALRVALDPTRLLPAVDPDAREMHLSLGAFLENLAQAAPAFGRDARIEVAAGPGPGGAVADVSLAPAPVVATSLAPLATRRTRRQGLGDVAPSPATTARLLAHLGGEGCFVLRGTAADTWLRAATTDAFVAQSARDDAQRELARWIRFRDAEARRARDGLTPSSMEVGGIGGWYMRTFLAADDVLTASFRERGNEGARAYAGEGCGFFVVTSADDGLPARIDAGRRLERLWLALGAHGLGAHPMSQALEEAPWRTEVARALGVPGVVQALLRVGSVAAASEPVSLRRPVAWFVDA